MNPIQNEQEYRDALRRIFTLMRLDPEDGTPECKELDMLSDLVEEYELVHYPIDPPPPVSHIPYVVYEAIYRAIQGYNISGQEAKLIEEWLDDLPESPRPDWSTAPEWAQYWTCDRNGQLVWHKHQPYLIEHIGMWMAKEKNTHYHYGDIEIPIGIDWRLLCEGRPEK